MSGLMADVHTRTREEVDTTMDLHPVRNATIGAFAVFGVVITAIEAQHATGTRWTLAISANIAFIAFVLYFTLLLIRQAQLGVRVRRTETPVYPDGQRTRVMVPADDTRRTWLLPGYELTDNEMRRLAVALQRNRWSFTRDTVRAARALPDDDVKSDWPGVVERFQRANIIDDGRMVTDTGRDLLTPYLPRSERFNPSRTPPPPPPPYAQRGEGDDDGRGGGE